MDRLISSEAGREYIKQLHLVVLGAGKNSRQALEKLSAIATDGHTQAQELVMKIDKAVQAGELVLPMSVEKPIEEFPLLPLAKAARILQAAAGSCGGGVPQTAWSAADQTRMARGEKPLGHPEHPNV